MQDVIVRLHKRVLQPFFWTTELGRQYTAIIGWGLKYMFKGDMSKDNCIRAFNDHTEEVKQRVPVGRLLIWRPQDGWEPLAKCVIPLSSCFRRSVTSDSRKLGTRTSRTFCCFRASLKRCAANGELRFVLCARFLEVPVPSTPFPAPQNEGSREMLGQMLRFIWRHPLASMGMRVYDHSGPLDFNAI